MRKNLLRATTLLMITVLTMGAYFYTSWSQNTTASAMNDSNAAIVVNGSGIVKVKPDIAYINLGVNTSNTDAKQAQTENTRLMDGIMKSLNKAGIPEDDIKTVGYNIYPQHRYDQTKNESIVTGYEVTNMVEVTIKNIDKVGEIIDLATESGANNINSVRFAVDDTNPHYQKALQQALQDAKQKATALAQPINVQINKPHRITEMSRHDGVIYKNYETADMARTESAMNTPISAGDLEISAQLQVEYRY
ncbi:protein of unknown function DUF541 [Alkaliphilus metalliredigens QYMF]|uniref:26 kDa periplasmic immunogenic protein n=1 Tax=Alkaliphilus metalliredigens (strain QYMF) TaxID=293826 RepID=A6TM80_ALKMQ|nr:SIMPL domain-containing protein [Alkaliphilus metalliredigens]ABR47298.1 protein of unknown function DUF541 [Alkaliphilus metalliredigens QYMF]